jgi:hypothetical protein
MTTAPPQTERVPATATSQAAKKAAEAVPVATTAPLTEEVPETRPGKSANSAAPPTTTRSVSAMTTAPLTEEVPETIPDGGVYGLRPIRRTLFRGGTPFRARALVETAISAINKVAQRIIPALRGVSQTNYLHNLSLEFEEGLITKQHSGFAAEVQMGITRSGDSNACGWIAAYNAFFAIGKTVPPAEIIKFIEDNNGLNVRGIFGTNPLIFDRLFSEYGVTTTTTIFEDAVQVVSDTIDGLMPSISPDDLQELPRGVLANAATLFALLAPVIKANVEPIIQQAILGNLHSTSSIDLDRTAKRGRVIILSYFNDINDIGEGAHYVAVIWDEEKGRYTAWNTGFENEYGEKTEEYFESINDWLNENNHGLISMTVIH